MDLRFTMTSALVFLFLTGSAVRSQDPAPEKPLTETVWDVLRGASKIEVFQLDPAGQEIFAGEWKFLGKATVTGPVSRKELIDALQEGVKKAGKKENKKFVPEYGVRATSGGTTVEMVIDYTNGEIRLFSEKRRAVMRTSDSPKEFFASLFKV
jgi:hypothetical protein